MARAVSPPLSPAAMRVGCCLLSLPLSLKLKLTLTLSQLLLFRCASVRVRLRDRGRVWFPETVPGPGAPK